jgi:hypothetical protein
MEANGTEDLNSRVVEVEKGLAVLKRARSRTRLEDFVKYATIFNVVAVPIVAAFLAYKVDMKLGRMSATIQEQANKIQEQASATSAANAASDRDASVMKDFAELYEKHPKLAIRFAAGIRNADLRSSLLHNTIWEALETNIDADKAPVWDTKHASWHLVGDAAYALSRTAAGNEQPFDQWWECDLRRYIMQTRWPRYRDELENIFKWLETTYKLPVVPASADADARCR